MPSALETLVKILKLEQDTSYQDKAVIGGLKSFASHWVPEAHAQAKKPEHHALVDELGGLLNEYGDQQRGERHEPIKYMLGRITGRIPSRNAPAEPGGSSLPAQPEYPVTQSEPRPAVAPPRAEPEAAAPPAYSRPPEREY